MTTMQIRPNTFTTPEQTGGLPPGHQSQELQDGPEVRISYFEKQLKLYRAIAAVLGDKVSSKIKRALESAENGSAAVFQSDGLYDMTVDESSELATALVLACKDDGGHPKDFLELFMCIWEQTSYCQWTASSKAEFISRFVEDFDHQLALVFGVCRFFFEQGAMELVEALREVGREAPLTGNGLDENPLPDEPQKERDSRISDVKDTETVIHIHLCHLKQHLKWSEQLVELDAESKAKLDRCLSKLQEFNNQTRKDKACLIQREYRLERLMLSARIAGGYLKARLTQTTESLVRALVEKDALERQVSLFNHDNCIARSVHFSCLQEQETALSALRDRTSHDTEVKETLQKKLQILQNMDVKAQREIHDLRMELILAKDDIPRQRRIEELEKTVREDGVVIKGRDRIIENLKRKVLEQEAAASYEVNFREAEKENIRLLDELYDAETRIQQKDEELREAISHRDDALKAKSSPKSDIITEPVVIVPKGESASNTQYLHRLLWDLQHRLAETENSWAKSKKEVEKLTADNQRLREEVEKHQYCKLEPQAKQKLQSGTGTLANDPLLNMTGVRTLTAASSQLLSGKIPVLTSSDFPPISHEAALVFSTTNPAKSKSKHGDAFMQRPKAGKKGRSSATQSTNSYAAAAKRPAVETPKMVRPSVRIGEQEASERPTDLSGSLTGVESAGHGRGKKGLTNMLKKQVERYNARN